MTLQFKSVGRTKGREIKVPILPADIDGQMRVLKALADLVHEDPCWVSKNMYGLDPWRGPSKEEPGQAEILESIFRERVSKLCVASGHATGKTYLSGVIPNMWFDANPWSYVIVTAAGHKAVRHMLIPRIRRFAKAQQSIRPIDK